MTGVTRVQTVSMGIDASETATDRTAVFPSAITPGNYILVLFSTRDNNPGNFTISDNKSNTWAALSISYDSGGGRGVSGAICLANSASQAAAPTVKIGKGGSAVGCGGTMFELNLPSGTVFDVAPVTGSTASTSPQVALGPTSYTNDLVMAVMVTGPTSFTTATPLSGYTTLDALNSSGIANQHVVIGRDTTATGSYTPGWSLTTAAQANMIAFALRGTTTAPTITSVSNPTPNYLGSVTINGVNFGASQGTGSVSIGGTSCTVTSWSDTAITVTVARGTNKYGVAVNTIVTINGGTVSNTSTAITSLQPQAGWSFVNVGTPNATSAFRVTAVADIASGDQLAWDTKSALVVVSSDGTMVWDQTVASFNVEDWTTGSGWGATGLQTTMAAAGVLAGVGGTAIGSVLGIGGVATASVLGVGGVSK